MLLNYFLEQLKDTPLNRNEELLIYVANLLMQNVKTSEELVTYKEPLCLQLNKIDQAIESYTVKRHQYQHLGNSSLLYSSLYRPAIKESGLSIGYIQSFGATAFMKAYTHGAPRINRLLSYTISDVSNIIAYKIKL